MRRQRYSSDLTQQQFKRLEPLLPACKAGGRPRKVKLYEVMCAIYYVLRNGCAWRNLPHDFPAWQTVYGYFRKFQADGRWEAINRFLLRRIRQKAGRATEPSAAIIDSQTVRCSPQAGIRGVDAGKKTNGRKRHIAVDTSGRLLSVSVTAGNIQDRQQIYAQLQHLKLRFPRLQLIWVDGGYSGNAVKWALMTLSLTLSVVKKAAGQRTFVVLPRRWVVERTLAWFTRYRRLGRDVEGRAETTEAWCFLANIQLMLRHD